MSCDFEVGAYARMSLSYPPRPCLGGRGGRTRSRGNIFADSAMKYLAVGRFWTVFSKLVEI